MGSAVLGRFVSTPPDWKSHGMSYVLLFRFVRKDQLFYPLATFSQ
ncbi:hypothetical protein B0I21_1185 [Sphingobacterium paludis]|uniref:Uncharacterized protein n=1 Tax=Sphingobacterium paludis TaxID=1476465 RepID=A0A4R7CQA5_9SPHI|nr:hypothetical protein B0I21_1185 [Sphingobacterium paludis]